MKPLLRFDRVTDQRYLRALLTELQACVDESKRQFHKNFVLCCFIYFIESNKEFYYIDVSKFSV